MYYVYIIQNQEGKRYIGYTGDLRNRIESHNKQSKGYTGKSESEWRLIYYEAYRSKKDALTRERRLKQHGNALRQLYKRIVKSLEPSEC